MASFAAPLSRDGPGLLLRDILSGEDAQIAAIADVVAHVAPDVLVLTDFDYDHDGVALAAFADMLAARGLPFDHRLALRPNSGMATGLDMDGNGRLGEARDAQGYGRFAGDGGMAVLSRLPIDREGVQDFSALLWRDLPGAVLPVRDGAPFPSAEAQAVQRLSSAGHWVVPVITDKGPVALLVWSATPPVFDGPEDMNGLRNRDEVRFWQLFLDGTFGPPPRDFVLMGNSNLDPADGDGLHAAMVDLLADARVQDPHPQSEGGLLAPPDVGQSGPAAEDTTDWPDGAPGNLRVTYVLPAATLGIVGAGVFWPAPDDPAAALLGEDGLAAGPHRLVWVEIVR